jgi:hypothetical protein
MKRRKVAYLSLRGTDEFPRFVITENGGYVWTGQGWSKDQKKAVLFAHPGEASRASQQVMRLESVDLPCKEGFSATVHIEVYSKAGIEPEELREWLVRAAQFNLAYGTYGSGPTKESLVLLNVHLYPLVPVEKTEGEKGGTT